MTIKNYKIGLKKNKANFVPLTPVSFLERTANVFPNYTAIITDNKSFTWKNTFDRCKLFASALKRKKIKTGDTISIIAPNTRAMYEAHFAIPMAGAVINAINLCKSDQNRGKVNVSNNKVLYNQSADHILGSEDKGLT